MQYELSLLKELAERAGDSYKEYDIWMVIRILERYNRHECYYGHNNLEGAMCDHFADMKWTCNRKCHECERYDKGVCLETMSNEE